MKAKKPICLTTSWATNVTLAAYLILAPMRLTFPRPGRLSMSAHIIPCGTETVRRVTEFRIWI